MPLANSVTCVKRGFGAPQQNYACRVASIQFEECDPANKDGDVPLSLAKKFRTSYEPIDLPLPRDAALIYELRLGLLSDLAAATNVTGGSGEPLIFERVKDAHAADARLLLSGRIATTGTEGGASPAEMGKGRNRPPTLLADPRNELSSESSDGESEGEYFPKRGISAPPPSGNLSSAAVALKTDIGWKEDRDLYQRFGLLILMGDNTGIGCPTINESDDALSATCFHLEVVSASSMHDVVFDCHFDVSVSMDFVKQFTQSVEQLNLRMNPGGWTRVDDFAFALGITPQELTIRARHYPSECIEFSVWKDPSDPKATHLHTIRASFGHIYIPVDPNWQAWHAHLLHTVSRFQQSARVHSTFILGTHCDQRHCHKATPRSPEDVHGFLCTHCPLQL